MKKYAGGLLLLIPVAAAVFILRPGLEAWFVADDCIHLGYMRWAAAPWGVWIKPITGGGIFRPVVFNATFLQERLFGLDPRAIHVVDLVLHSLNVSILFLFVHRLWPVGGGVEVGPAETHPTEKISGGSAAWFAALSAGLVFAAHPVGVLTAVWFACRADLLGTFFSLLALYFLAGAKRLFFLRGLGVFFVSLLAMLAKETYYPLFITAFFVGWAKTERRGREGFVRSAFHALPPVAALAVVVGWRFMILGGGGLYGPVVPSSLSEFFWKAWYHVPRVALRAARDLAVHHLRFADYLMWPLLGSGMILFLSGLPLALMRRRKEMAAGLAMIAAGLLPLWNVSHMLAAREERLLYFPLAGFCVLLSAMVGAPRSLTGRLVGLCAVGSAAATLALASGNQVEEWKLGTDRKQFLARAIYEYIRNNSRPGGGGRTEIHSQAGESEINSSRFITPQRFYILGTEKDDYYLDFMVKLMGPDIALDLEVMPADQPGFLWGPAGKARPSEIPPGRRDAFPRREIHLTDPRMSFQTVHPPDLLAAARKDPAARILSWNGRSLRDLTDQTRQLFNLRAGYQNEARLNPSSLPSFSFKKSRINFEWDVSPRLEVVEPFLIGVPYTLIAHDSDPYLVSPSLSFPALAADKMEMEMTLPRKPYLPPGQDKGCLMWQTERQAWFSPEHMICFPLTADGEPRLYLLHLSANYHWVSSGIITRLRLDPLTFPASFQLHRLEFFTE